MLVTSQERSGWAAVFREAHNPALVPSQSALWVNFEALCLLGASSGRYSSPLNNLRVAVILGDYCFVAVASTCGSRCGGSSVFIHSSSFTLTNAFSLIFLFCSETPVLYFCPWGCWVNNHSHSQCGQVSRSTSCSSADAVLVFLLDVQTLVFVADTIIVILI